MYVIVYGNPFDGLAIVGTFVDTDEADFYAQTFLRDEEYWFVKVDDREDDSEEGL